jgi:hypothetical protein
LFLEVGFNLMSSCLYFFFAIQILAQTSDATYDLNAARFIPIDGISSADTLIQFKDKVYFGAGLDDPRPGVYEIAELGATQASSLIYDPQFDITAFYHDDEQLTAVASRHFSPLERDWTAQQTPIDFANLSMDKLQPIPISPNCYNGKHGCGLTAILYLEPGHLLTLRKQQVARLNTWRIFAGVWERQKDFSIGIQRRSNRIVDVKRKADHFYFLLQDRWLLGRTGVSQLLENHSPYMELEVDLDFSILIRRLKQRNRAVGPLKLLSSFTWDDQDNLWLLINPKGFPLTIDGEDPSRKAHWLHIPKTSNTSSNN